MGKTVKTILKNNNMYSDELKKLDYHMRILDVDANELLSKLLVEGFVPKTDELSEQEIATALLTLIKNCDVESETYDRSLDEEMIRIGLGLKNDFSKDRDESYLDDNADLMDSYEAFMDHQSGLSR
ncbi:MAG: hypothetical protein IJL74_02510 [Bacilli bacterium]|nr:hypothetical protein [Bacilli bacterium]